MNDEVLSKNNFKQRQKESGSFIMLQVTVCVIVLVMAVALKFVDKETFQDFKNWYNFKLNETLKVGSMQNDCDSLLKFFFNEISKEDHLNQG